MTQLQVQANHTPAFVREFCTQKFMLFTSILDEIILGGLPVSAPAAKQLKARGAVVVTTGRGKRKTQLAVATISERLKAIEMYGKFGPGIRTDHRVEDGPPGRSVVLMPPWEGEEAEFEDVTTVKGALPSGNGDEPPNS